MGKISVWKLPDLTHEIFLEKERKVRKIVGRGNKIHMNRSEDHSRGSIACKALWFWGELRNICYYRYNSTWTMFSNQVDKQICNY
jgi:hypothetical protein